MLPRLKYMLLLGLWLLTPCLTWADSDFEIAMRIYKQHDYTLAAKWLTKAAKHGEVKAQNYLAYMYVQGKGVSQNYVQAIFWYRKAAEQGSTLAQKNLRKLMQTQQAQACTYNSNEPFADYANCPERLFIKKQPSQDGIIQPEPDWYDLP